MNGTIRFEELVGFVYFKTFLIPNNQIKLSYYQIGAVESNGIDVSITTTSKERRLDLLKQMKEEIERCIKECTE